MRRRPEYFASEQEALDAPRAISAEEFLGGWLARPSSVLRELFVDAKGVHWSVDEVEDAENGR